MSYHGQIDLNANASIKLTLSIQINAATTHLGIQLMIASVNCKLPLFLLLTAVISLDLQDAKSVSALLKTTPLILSTAATNLNGKMI
jgi:hypothetical protein